MNFNAEEYKEKMFNKLQESKDSPLLLFVVDGKNHRYADNLNEYYKDFEKLTDLVERKILRLEKIRNIKILNRGHLSNYDDKTEQDYMKDVVFIEKQSDKRKYLLEKSDSSSFYTGDVAYFNPNFYLGDSIYFSVYNKSISVEEFKTIFDKSFKELGFENKHAYYLSHGYYQTDNYEESIDKVFRLDVEKYIEKRQKYEDYLNYINFLEQKDNKNYTLFLIKPDSNTPEEQIIEFTNLVTKQLESIEQKKDISIINKDKGILYLKTQESKTKVMENVYNLFKTPTRGTTDRLILRMCRQSEYNTNVVTDEAYGPLYRANAIDSNIYGSYFRTLNPYYSNVENLISFSVYKDSIDKKQFENLLINAKLIMDKDLNYKLIKVNYNSENPAKQKEKLYRYKVIKNMNDKLEENKISKGR